MDEFSGKDEAFVEQWLVHQALEKFVVVLKVCFLNFGYSFIYLKYLMLKTESTNMYCCPRSLTTALTY